MDGGTHSAYTSDENPGITWVTVFHDRFDSAHHRAGAICVFNLSILYIGLDPEVPFYAGKRVYYYSF